jgi:hypothetical protein
MGQGPTSRRCSSSFTTTTPFVSIRKRAGIILEKTAAGKPGWLCPLVAPIVGFGQQALVRLAEEWIQQQLWTLAAAAGNTLLVLAL